MNLRVNQYPILTVGSMPENIRNQTMDFLIFSQKYRFLKGTFSFPGVPGDYLVGIWLPPGSGFGYVEEKRYRVDESGKLFDAENNEKLLRRLSNYLRMTPTLPVLLN